jgi:uncharacterized membrane protein YeaQ/YmgE (transglycosylase-associated protein family)
MSEFNFYDDAKLKNITKGDSMHILFTILIGFIIGLIARALVRGPQPAGFVLTTLLGIAGALLAHWIGTAFGWYLPDQPAGFIASVIGAVLVLSVYVSFRRRRMIA